MKREIRKSRRNFLFNVPIDAHHHHGNVVLNFQNSPRTEYGPYGNAFRRAADSLVQDLVQRNGYSDLEALPIVFLYRQALELLVKGIVLMGNDIISIAGKRPVIHSEQLHSHRLSQLVPALVQIFDEVNWKWELDVDGMRDPKEFHRFLLELERIDPLSSSFRYPTDKKGSASLPEHFHLNLIDFAATMSPILEVLEGAIFGLDEKWQALAEGSIQ